MPTDASVEAEQQVRIDDLVDRCRNELGVAAIDGLMEAAERRFVAGGLGRHANPPRLP
jgi:hypothetical protein